MKINKIKGFADLFAPFSSTHTYMENLARKIFAAYGFTEVRTPILEYTELFQRTIGEETDVVHKEMYTFTTEKGRSYSLRPEATAGVMRAYIENARYSQEGISRLFTTGPMFRHERPQKGRLRQFHQLNCECLGSQSPICDADMICMLMHYLRKLGLKEVQLELNSLGCQNCRSAFKTALMTYLQTLPKSQLCPDCLRRLETNPLRVLDCKQLGCIQSTEQAPKLIDYLCNDCKIHFEVVCSYLDDQNIPYHLNHRLVRGLDYYCRTTFEVVSTCIGAQSAIAGGGRYDGLIQSLGGPDVPGIGFACGMERIALLIPAHEEPKLDFYCLVMDENGLQQGFNLVQKLRALGLTGEMNFQIQGFKSLMRQANKSGARFCLLLGLNEVAEQKITIKNMSDGTQETMPIETCSAYLTGYTHD